MNRQDLSDEFQFDLSDLWDQIENIKYEWIQERLNTPQEFCLTLGNCIVNDVSAWKHTV